MAIPTSFVAERINAKHVLGSFSCGRPELDLWLRDSALNADRMSTGRTYVWTSERQEVVAYYTLAPHLVLRAGLPRALSHGAPDAIPSILIARLALDERLQGKGVGQGLLVDALHRVVAAVRLAGGRLIVVDAIDEGAASFYERFGFRRTTRSLRLVRKSSDVEKSLNLIE